MDAKKQLVQELADVEQRILVSQKDFEQIKSASLIQSMRIQESKLKNQAAQLDQRNILSSNVLSETSPLFRRAVNQGNQIQLLKSFTQNIVFAEELRQLDSASQITVERYQKLLLQLQSVVQQFDEWTKKEIKLFQQYIDLADIAGTRSDLELKAAERALVRADAENIGAALALANTLMRLERADEAKELLGRLAAMPLLRPLALALRGEIHTRLGDQRAARLDFAEALKLGKNESRVHWIRALGNAVTGDLDAAETEWKTVLRLGGSEIDARRSLAFTYLSQKPDNPANVKKALEQAQLAVGLSGEEDWSCHIALALALAANGEKDKAIEAAKKAHSLAVGNKSELCFDIVEQLKANVKVTWEF